MAQTMVQIISDQEPEGDDVFGDHCWHYRYNRRLSCFQHCVTSLTFSQDGQYLVSGTGSGDVKIWDTGVWAERAKLKSSTRTKEEPRALSISPAQRWLVVAHASVLNIYNCQPPWRLEHVMPAPIDVTTKESSEWHCIAFSPMSEVDHPGGHTGQDNHLAAFASNVLCVLDYSGGWSSETPKRTRSVFNSSMPTSIAYTACGFWVVCGYECGQVQIWNHFSLTLEKTLSAHTGNVNSITASPRSAPYDPRFVSCSMDRTLRVWHSAGWCLEQIAPDTRADRNGIRSCTFSSTGNWLVSVATELCLWSVCVSGKGRLELRCHQRFGVGDEGLGCAAFCAAQDAIAVGSRDGVLGLWMKLPGLPPDQTLKELPPVGRILKKSDSNGVTGWIMDRPLTRPMMHVSPAGHKSLNVGEERRSLRNSEWFVRSDMRSLTMTASCVYRGIRDTAERERGKPKPVTSNVRKLLNGRDRARKNASHDWEAPDDAVLEHSKSVPELKRWKPNGYEFEDVISPYCDSTDMLPGPSPNKTLPAGFLGGSRPGSKQGNKSCWGNDELASEEPAMSVDMTNISSLKKAIMQKHAAQGAIRRILLDPQSIC